MGQSNSLAFGPWHQNMSILSPSENILPDTVGMIQDEVIRQARVLSEIATLSYEDFLIYLKQLNELSRIVTGDEGKQLLFAVKKGTDSTVLWKGTVRIACVKIDAKAKQIETYRLLNLNQFLKVFRTMQCQLNAALQSIQNEVVSLDDSKPRGKSSGTLVTNSSSSCSADSSSGSENFNSACSDKFCVDEDKNNDSTTMTSNTMKKNKRPANIKLVNIGNSGLTASLILEKVDELTSEINKNGDKLGECSICMERKPNVLLPCAHAYCKICIERWNKSHKTCPFCRETLDSDDDTWVISDIPGLQEINDEICSALMNLTSSPQ